VVGTHADDEKSAADVQWECVGGCVASDPSAALRPTAPG